MSDLEDKVDRWDHEYLQEQVWELESLVRDLTERLKKLEERLTDDGK